MKKEFKQLLEEMGCVTPGKGLEEVKVLFLGKLSITHQAKNRI